MGKLVRLELYNFKSYKGHHILLFNDSYFTSIIGPNGSGKSNAMDAISFVLGIKSSHLRSTHLRDLIYRGRILKTSKINADGTATEDNTDANAQPALEDGNAQDSQPQDSQPQGSQRDQATSAWVMAVYEDDAGEEQRWKRTITSSLNSEYRINNRVVHAKQYNAALEAENILIKARNFLVFQGDVEAIASQSPKDLTRLVEQISGSLEFKQDYDRLEQETEKAAEDQTYILNQRRGMNAEIKQFSEQKKEAESFQRKADERDQAIVTHILFKLYHFQQVIDDSSAEIKKHQDELREHRRKLETYEKLLEDAKKDQARVGRDMSKAERSIKSIEKQTEEKQNMLVPIDEKIAISVRNLEKYKKRIVDVSKESKAQADGVDELRKNLAIVQKAQKKWEDDFKQQAKKQGRQLDEADLHEYNRLRADVSRRAVSAQSKVDNLTRQYKTDAETANTLKSNLDELERQFKRLEIDTQVVRSRRDEASVSVKQYSKDVDSKRKEANKFTSERLRTEQRRTELDEKLQEVLRKLLEADNGRRQSEKDVRSRETLANLRRMFPGVRGRLHELCKPKQKKYETAVSTVLGRHFDSVVVDSEKTAKDCIQHLRDQRSGQATFIPLDTIQANSSNSNFRGMHSGMRLAIDTIDYDHSVGRAVSYACGNSMVCDDLETAKHLCYEKNIDAKAVTLDGTVIHKGGLMTGGRGPNDRNARKWEEKEVEDLRRLKDKFVTDLAAFPKGHKSATDAELAQGELTGLEQRLSFAGEELKSYDKNLTSKKSELASAQKKLQETRPKYEEMHETLDALHGRIQENQAEVSEVEDEVFAVFCQRLKYDNVREYESQQGSLQQESSQKKLEFTMQRSKLENQSSFEMQRLEATSGRLQSLRNQEKRDQELIAVFESERDALQTEIDSVEASLEGIRAEFEQQKTSYNTKADKISQQRRELQKHNKDADFVLKTVTGLEAELQRNAAGRYALLRKCKIDEVKVPLTENSASLDTLPVDELSGQRDPDAMDTAEDGDVTTMEAPDVRDYGIEVDYDDLDEEIKEVC